MKVPKKGSNGTMVQLYSMGVKLEDENICDALKGTLKNHYRIFQEIPKGIPLSRDHEH